MDVIKRKYGKYMRLSGLVYVNDSAKTSYFYLHPENFGLISVTQTVSFRASVVEVFNENSSVFPPEGAPM
jgi:hypothetical protein